MAINPIDVIFRSTLNVKNRVSVQRCIKKVRVIKVIIVYDVDVQRLNNVRKLLKQYLMWVQNSAFEGEISEGRLEEIRVKLFEIIDPNTDSVLVYTADNPTWIHKKVWGIEKGYVDNLI